MQAFTIKVSNFPIESTSLSRIFLTEDINSIAEKDIIYLLQEYLLHVTKYETHKKVTSEITISTFKKHTKADFVTFSCELRLLIEEIDLYKLRLMRKRSLTLLTSENYPTTSTYYKKWVTITLMPVETTQLPATIKISQNMTHENIGVRSLSKAYLEHDLPKEQTK